MNIKYGCFVGEVFSCRLCRCGISVFFVVNIVFSWLVIMNILHSLWECRTELIVCNEQKSQDKKIVSGSRQICYHLGLQQKKSYGINCTKVCTLLGKDNIFSIYLTVKFIIFLKFFLGLEASVSLCILLEIQRKYRHCCRSKGDKFVCLAKFFGYISFNLTWMVKINSHFQHLTRKMEGIAEVSSKPALLFDCVVNLLPGCQVPLLPCAAEDWSI